MNPGFDGALFFLEWLANFIDAYNYGHRLKVLKGLTPYEFIRKQWTSEPERFKVDPIHFI
ncbi:hypothetical protein SM19410_08330 [Xanthomonas hortorum pv. gardneri]|nr:hypothetical protein BJD10_03870 [Xanthomonas hortorum pv. gardneri]EGD16954.1 hypothetical protein XGA_4447 [Xanthomonas hortorum ATCC 19865]PPU43698.1 hypothetical protein XcyCFBP4188_10205 [Xanthomonas hortorum pv. cynarae]KLA98495.1 hypothetical protein SM19410_08330 [Xanthomonas hortorum pv. gardneri]KLB03676.1 hypothetical protein SM17710_00280 [Xanthomonas hortorum pv. gardneri]